MPTKDELQQELDDLRAEMAALQAEMAGLPICQRVCACGLRFHQDPPCYSHIQGDMVTACVCQDHPESAPPAKANVEDAEETANA